MKSGKTPPNTPSPSFSADSAVRLARALARSDATPINKKLTHYYNSGIAGGVSRHLSVSDDEESTGSGDEDLERDHERRESGAETPRA